MASQKCGVGVGGLGGLAGEHWGCCSCICIYVPRALSLLLTKHVLIKPITFKGLFD